MAKGDARLRKQRLSREADAKRLEMLQYYAKTDVSAERVAEHLGIPVEAAAAHLKDLRKTEVGS